MEGRLFQALGLLMLTTLALVPEAKADEPSRTTPLHVQAAPLFGPGAPVGPGWFSCSLRLTNPGPGAIEGTIELQSSLNWYREPAVATTRAPFALADGSSVTLQLPTHGFFDTAPELVAVARDRRGTELTRVELSATRSEGPVLLSLAVPARFAHGVRDQPVHLAWRGDSGGYGTPTVRVTTPEVNSTSGDLVLPDRPTGYAAATVVVAPGSALARLGQAERQALADWVLGGGALALAVEQPEDLVRPLLQTFVGARAESTSPPPEIAERHVFEVPDPGSSTLEQHVERPSPDVAAALVGYRGGNLHASPWGAAASYGLGEIHLLAFDPFREPGVNDPWVHLQLVELLRHAYHRQAQVVLPHGISSLRQHGGGGSDSIRRLLDPNERTEWTIGAATLLLVLYALLAGPLTFRLAARRQRPLRALLYLPLWSLGAMLLIIILGVAAKGVHGQSRHLSLIEVGGGMTRGSITRFRAFFLAGSRELTVAAEEMGNVLDVLGATDRTIVVDRNGMRLEQLRTKSWQPVLVREDGFSGLGGGIALVPTGGDVTIVNRTGRDLVGVVVNRPDGAIFLIDRIPLASSAAASSGRKLAASVWSAREALPSGAEETLDDIEPDLGAAWQALDDYCSHGTEWWPAAAPVLIAQLAGGAGKTVDSGVELTHDRLLVRVVGWGGAP